MERTLFEPEHEELRSSFRAWLDKEIVPNYLEWEEAGIVPHDVFVEAGKHGHFGLAGMRERADRIGATLTVVTSTQAGTDVVITVPGRVGFLRADDERRGSSHTRL